MANTALNVSAGKPKVTGGIYRAPLGTALPTDASTALTGTYESLGYIATDGVTHAFEFESGDYRAWGGDIVLSYLTSKTNRFSFGLIEVLNKTTYETIYGPNAVSGTLSTGITVAADGSDPSEYVYVIELAMRDGAMKRIVIPEGALSEVGEVVYKDDEAVGYELTLNALPDSTNVNHYEYIALASGTTVTITLSDSSKSIVHGNTYQLTATTSPERGRVVWGTSDPTKATVSQSGLVTGVAAGSATITAYFAGVTASCAVTVT